MRARPNDDGSVLVLSLWIVAAVALVATAVIAMGRVQQSVARNAADSLRDRISQQSGIQVAIHGLLAQSLQWKIDVPRDVSVSGSRIRVQVADEAGKIDLNVATDEVLMRAMIPARLNEGARRRIVDALQDWRDTDEERRLQGAEKPDYAKAGYRYGPRNRPLANLPELQRVAGMTPDTYRRVQAALTVYSQRAAVNIHVATPDVLRLLPGMDEASVASAIRSRQTDMASTPEATMGRVFSIQATIPAKPSAGEWRAVVYLTGQKESPVRIKAWSVASLIN